MPVKRHYLKIGHSDIRILPIVIDVEDEQWFAEEYSEFMKLININSNLLLNFQTKQSISDDSFGEESEDVGQHGTQVDFHVEIYGPYLRYASSCPS